MSIRHFTGSSRTSDLAFQSNQTLSETRPNGGASGTAALLLPAPPGLPACSPLRAFVLAPASWTALPSSTLAGPFSSLLQLQGCLLPEGPCSTHCPLGTYPCLTSPQFLLSLSLSLLLQGQPQGRNLVCLVGSAPRALSTEPGTQYITGAQTSAACLGL